ncbi:MAG TPA: beta-glucuronidase, partial [Spirochaetota bacterium]
MLYPRESEYRELKDLSGVWEFKIDKTGQGMSDQWFEKKLSDTIMMPVPSSYNDITQDVEVRDHIGDVWYERTFFVPAQWIGSRIVIRVGSATHHAVLWINGSEVARHKGGYLPFEADISGLVKCGRENRITMKVGNILDWTTLPPGEVTTLTDGFHPEEYKVQKYFHDFYNYAGIHRPVIIYSTPKLYIRDISVRTDIAGTSGIIHYSVDIVGNAQSVRVRISDDRTFLEQDGETGSVTIPHARFWEPGNAHLYEFYAELVDSDGRIIDCYRLPIGIRTVKVVGNQFLINDKPFYFKGFGKHEDSDIAGKGLSHVFNIKDFNLLKWIGANSFRTSHYPYAEEIYDMADREGIVIIDEAPATGLNLWDKKEKVFCDERAGSALLFHHKDVIREMIDRDKNHPCVVMWSIANEANTYEEGAYPYFESIVKDIRALDPTRPVTIVQSSHPSECRVAQLCDVICVNRYYSWYVDPGHLELVEFQVEKELTLWNERFHQPVIMSEYGADAIAGFH